MYGLQHEHLHQPSLFWQLGNEEYQRWAALSVNIRNQGEGSSTIYDLLVGEKTAAFPH